MTWQQWCGFIPAVSSIFVGIYLIAPVDEDEDEEDEEFCSKEEVSSRQRKDSLTVGVDIGDICNVQQETISGLSPMNAGNTGTMPQKRSRRSRPSDTGINVDFKQIDNFRRGSNATKSRMMFMGASRMNEHNLSRKMEAFAEEQRLQVLLCKKSLSAKDVEETKNLMNRLIAEAKSEKEQGGFGDGIEMSSSEATIPEEDEEADALRKTTVYPDETGNPLLDLGDKEGLTGRATSGPQPDQTSIRSDMKAF
eukprot:FR742518.1.p1 GENE.FR742518.1~~FR742518.1.p1  ORF type:complete len:290 (+),score=26.90 FR742518.1:118-870(+)